MYNLLRDDALGRNEESLLDLDQALALEPDNAGILRSKGDVLIGLDRYEEALQSLEQALALEPENSRTLEAKEKALHKLKQREEAKERVPGTARQREEDSKTKKDLFGTLDMEKYQESLKPKPDPEKLATLQLEGSAIKVFCILCGEYSEVPEEALDLFARDDGFEKPDKPRKYYLETYGCRCHRGTLKSTLKKIPGE